MPIRVIAGSAKGRQLKLVPGDTTRPIMDRAKEALFSILGRSVLDSYFMDLFAGTGSVGIEALSRGAHHVLFVEMESRAIHTIQGNLAVTGLGEKALIRRADVFALLRQSSPQPYEFVYVAPPQYKRLWSKTLDALDASKSWFTESTRVIAQIDPREYQPVTLEHFVESDQRTYGQTMLVFYDYKDSEDSHRG